MIALLFAAALSADLPRYPVDQRCDLAARGWHASGPLNPGARALCINQEQDAYEWVRRGWVRFDPDLRDRCARASQTYEGLLDCLGEHIPVQQSRGDPHFRYDATK